jgi:ketosteroid isomerase-like protein
MSQENVETVREALDAYYRGDKAGWTKFMDPDLETFPVPEFPEPDPVIGPDAAWDFYLRFADTMAESETYETTELVDAGERVFSCSSGSLHGRGSGVEIEFKLWGVHTFDQGRWIRTQWFGERSEALEAAGLSE